MGCGSTGSGLLGETPTGSRKHQQGSAFTILLIAAGSTPAALASHAQPRQRKVHAAVMSLPRWVGMFPALRVATDRRVR